MLPCPFLPWNHQIWGILLENESESGFPAFLGGFEV